MKKFTFLLLFLVSVLFAQTIPVSLTDAQKIADANAQVLWGANLNSADPIPYYGFDDKVLAWCFNYAIDKPFPTSGQMKQRSVDAEQTDNRDLGWGVGEFGYLIIGANRSMPVFIEYSKSLSTDYALKVNLDKAALKAFPKGYELVNTYYLGAASIWNCVTDGTETRYINLMSKPMTLKEDEFRQMLRERKNSWLDNDFRDEWTDFLDNNQTLNLSRSVTKIPGEEFMPFYEWSYGCVPCAATTVLAWWDNYHNLGKLIDYHGSRWDPIVETYRHHVPQLLPIVANKMETGGASGNTDPWDVNDGLEDAAATQGYTFDCEGSWGLFSDWHFMHGIIDYVDNNTPGLATIDPGWLDYHTVAAVGYNMSPAQVLVHDANHPALTTYSYSILECYWYVYPEATQTNGVKILSPYGGTQWGGNGGGNEVLHSGDYFEINWSSSTEVDSTYVKLFYNDEGGGAAERWFPITSFTANDGQYDWLVPNISCIYGTSTQYARIKIELYNAATNQLIAQDGSFGNFTINAGGSLAQLSETSAEVLTSPDYYLADRYEEDTWYALGVADNGVAESSYWKIELFSDATFNNKLEEFYHWDSVNYIMVDNHHLPTGEWGVKLRSNENNPTITARAQLVGDPSMVLSPGLTNANWFNTNSVRIWNVYLNPGDYYFEMNINGNDADLDFALFKWGGDGIFTIEDAVASSVNPGGGGRESFHYSPFEAGYYGLCVSSRTRVSTSYSILLNNAGVWDGSVSSSWTDPANWTSNSVPTFNNDVIIPVGCSHYPILNGGVSNAVYAKTLTINHGARLYLNDAYLNVYGDLRVGGNLSLYTSNDVVDVTGNVFWDNGSTALCQGSSTINCYQNWTFGAGSQVALHSGNVVFVSDNDSYIVCNSAQSGFNTLKVNKSGGALTKFNESSANDLIIYNDLNIMTGSVFTSNSSQDIIVMGLFVTNGSFRFDAGTMKFGGTNAYLECAAGDYFYNVMINTSGVTALLSNLYLHGDMIINSGGIMATTYTLYIGGNWYNNMGSGAFNKGTSTVVFNNNGQVEVVNGSFYIMEINNPDIELHFESGVSTCDRYNWTAGTLYIDGGTLTINDLVDNGIYGRTYVHRGTLNITQDSYQQVHLNGELHISGGTMNVTGGINYCYLPGDNHAWLEMSDGVLDFKTVGINIRSCAYLLTADITGGVIRTVGNIACDRVDFQPAGGTFEMYGSADKAINIVSQSKLPNLIINKPGSRDALIETSRNSGDMPGEYTRSNTISLSSNLSLSGDLIVTAGSFNLNGHTVSAASAVEIYGNLIMNNAADILNVGTSINWYNGQGSTVSNGVINVNQDWTNESSVILSIGTANTVNFVGEESSTLYLEAPGMSFGNMVINKTAGITEIYTGIQYLNVEGNITLSAGDTLWFHNCTAQIEGTFDLNGVTSLESGSSVTTYDLNLNGTISLYNGLLTVAHNCTEASSGVLNLYSGNFIIDRAYTGNFYNFGGAVNIYGGVIQITNDGIQFGAGSRFYMENGTLKVGWNFKATYTNVFQTDGGTVEFIGARTAFVECNNGNYFTDVICNKASLSNQIYFSTPIIINNDLIIRGGDTVLGSQTHTITRDVVIEGGWLSSAAGTILNVGRSWNNSAGVSAYGQSTGTVNFVSDQVGTISVEEFYHLNINKTSASAIDLTIPSGTLTVNGNMSIQTGGLKVNPGAILDVNGNLSLNGGALDLNSSSGTATLRIAGMLFDERDEPSENAGILATQYSTIIFDGSGNQSFGSDLPADLTSVCNVVVNKSGGKVQLYDNLNIMGNFTINNGEWGIGTSGKTKNFYGNLVVETGGVFSDSTGTSNLLGSSDANIRILGIAKFGTLILNKTLTNNLILSGNTSLSGTTTITLTSGTVNLNGFLLKYKGSMTIGTDGKLYLTGGSTLNINESSTLTIGSGGEFYSIGSQGNPARVTADTGYYAFTTSLNSLVGADYTIFEKMNTTGISIQSRCSVDPLHSFYHCTFRNGQTGGSLLRMNCQNVVEIIGAVFPANTWGGSYNVYRTTLLGSVTFRSFSGAFAGADYDYTTNNSIFWVTPAPPDAPQNVRISVTDNTAIITWNVVNGATGYLVYRSFIPGVFTQDDIVAETDMTTYSDESVSIYPKAFYMIKAYVE